MLEIFDDAFGYLKMALRSYVSARHVIEKLLATRLVVISMTMSVDALSLKYQDIVGEIESFNNVDTGNIQQASYESRVSALRIMEDNFPEKFDGNTLSESLSRAINSLLLCYDEQSIANLLNLDFKAFLNEAQFFVLKIRSLIANDT